MPTKRKRTKRNKGPSDLTMAILGIGCGINHMPDAELKALWREFGPQVTEYYLRKSGTEPFVAEIARSEGWPP
jgi:hypothetical protein